MNFQQQIIGVINLSLPVIIIFYMIPSLLVSVIGTIAVAVALGVYIWYLNFMQLKGAINALLYAPTGAHKEMFEELIRSCGLSAETVQLKYAYTAEQIAMTMSNAVIIDPTLCTLCDDDLGGEPVKNVFHQIFAPKLTHAQVQRLSKYKQILSPEVQCFIFKHELGHVVDNYSNKKLWIVFITGIIAVYFAILTAKILLAVSVFGAIVGGMLVGGIVDLLLTYASNLTFKLSAEKKADLFAAQHSSVDQIKAAAIFFEKHQEILNQHKESSGFFENLPSVLLTGHLDGKARSAYLLSIARQKNL